MTRAALAFVATLAIGIGWKGTGYDWQAIPPVDSGGPSDTVADTSTGTLSRTDARRVRSLEAQLRRTEPRRPYIVIDRTHNRLYLRSRDATLLDAVCSAGSGAVLDDPDGTRQWTFSTPRGRFEVRSKTRNPVWRKPDWAFIEEGKPVPADPRERFEYGSLGEYALHLGDGYMIHGTLYERLLGRSVSHGCVRLGRDDLRTLYASAPVGTQVYVY
jgi:L,D-transpeptidase YbiS